MGARMILGKVIAAPIAAASMALQDMQTEQTLRLQRQLLAAEGDVDTESSFPKKRDRGHGLLRSKRRPATMAKADKAKELSSSHTVRPLPAAPAAEVVTVSEEEFAGDWCQVQRHGEHPKRSTAEKVEEPVQSRQVEVRPERCKRPTTHKEVSQIAPLVAEGDRSLDRARKVPSGNAAPTGAPAYAPPPPSERALCVDETLEVPRSIAVRMSAPPTAAPVLDALQVKIVEEQRQQRQQRSVFSAPSRPPPRDVPPPPCPGCLEPKIAMVSPPPRLWSSNYDMGCFSGGTGGTPGLSDLEVRREAQCDSALEDDVAKRLEAMVEDLAGPGFDFLEDAFSKVDAAREALLAVVAEPGLRLHHTAPAFIPGQMWPGTAGPVVEAFGPNLGEGPWLNGK